MKKYWLQGLCNNAFWVLTIGFATLMFCMNFYHTAVISYDTYEHVTITNTPWVGVLFCALGGLGVIAASFLLKLADKINEKAFFCVFAIIYIAMGLYIINGCDTTLRSDPAMVFDAARWVSLGNYDYFEQGSYLHSYPHQTGLMLYDALLRSFGKDASVNFTVNLLMVIGINYVFLKISDITFESKLVNIVTVVLSFSFLPQLFFVMFAYGLIPGFLFMSLAFYYTLKLVKSEGLIYILPLGVFMALAVILRKNYIIGAFAIVIYLFVMSKSRVKVRLLAAVCVLACAILPMKMILGYFEYKTGNDLDNGVPSVMWIAMGTDLENRDRAPGWYNGFNYYTYIQQGYNAEPTAEIGVEKLKSNLEQMKSDPKAAVEFFYEKSVSMWCENTYQSIWSGPLEECSQYTENDILRDIYNGGETESGVAFFCESVSQMIWLFLLIFLVAFAGRCDGWQIMLLFFVGGVLFHLMWEGKSQYIYPYVFCLIPCAAYAFVRCALRVRGAAKKLKVGLNKQI